MEAKPRTSTLTTAEKEIVRIVPQRFRGAVEQILEGGRADEIRFIIDRPMQAAGRRGEQVFLQLKPFTKSEACEMLEAICGHSVFAREQELLQGYVTLAGGARVGICGKPLYENGKVTRLTAVTSFNIRIPREVIGCAERFIGRFFDGSMPLSAIIAAAPGAGKTTFLRDCARCLSDGIGQHSLLLCNGSRIGVPRSLRVAVADERNELSGTTEGHAAMNLGIRTDIMEGIPKAAAIPMLVRSMAPDVIITDELSGAIDTEAVSEAAKYGIAVIASIHAGNTAQLRSKAWLRHAVEDGLFAKVFLLRRTSREISLYETDILDENKRRRITRC